MINEDILRILDTNGKLLYLLLEEGSQRFEEIVETLNPFEKMKKYKPNPNSKLPKSQTQTAPHTNPKVFMSRGTISKRLKYLKDPNRKYIEQISELDVTTNRTILKYQITATGKAFLTQLIRTEQVSVRPDQFEPIYAHITEFFQRIGVDPDLYLPQLIKMIARIDPAKLFQLPQTD